MNQLWRQGPEWLYADVPWVEPEPCTSMPGECAVELKGAPLPSLNLVTADFQGSISELMSCDRFSTLSRLLRVTAYVVRAIKSFKGKREAIFPGLTSEELAHAEMLWIRSAQQHLVNQPDFKVQQKQFNLFIDDKNIWCCGG